MDLFGQAAAGSSMRTATEVQGEPENEVDAIHRRLLGLTKAVGMNADRARRVVDRLSGGQPEKDHPATPRPVRSGSLGAIHDLLDEIDASACANTVSLDALDKLA